MTVVTAGRAAQGNGPAAAVSMTWPPAASGTENSEAGWARLFVL